jgi:hypothetical protein
MRVPAVVSDAAAETKLQRFKVTRPSMGHFFSSSVMRQAAYPKRKVVTVWPVNH